MPLSSFHWTWIVDQTSPRVLRRKHIENVQSIANCCLNVIEFLHMSALSTIEVWVCLKMKRRRMFLWLNYQYIHASVFHHRCATTTWKRRFLTEVQVTTSARLNIWSLTTSSDFFISQTSTCENQIQSKRLRDSTPKIVHIRQIKRDTRKVICIWKHKLSTWIVGSVSLATLLYFLI